MLPEDSLIHNSAHDSAHDSLIATFLGGCQCFFINYYIKHPVTGLDESKTWPVEKNVSLIMEIFDMLN